MRVLEGKSVFSGIAIGKISILQKILIIHKRVMIGKNTSIQRKWKERSKSSYEN